MTNPKSIAGSVVATLRPGPEPLAVGAALRAVVAAAAVATAVGVVAGDLRLVGVAYLGMSCSVAFLAGSTYPARLLALVASAAGASIGIAVGALLDGDIAVLIATGAVAGVVSGVVGSLGAAGPGFGIMLSIGVAFGQFEASPLHWWQQSLGYLLGAAVVGAATFSPWLFRRRATERRLVADVYFAIADLCSMIGTDQARAARLTQVAVSAKARNLVGYPEAERTAVAAAALYARGNPLAPEAAAAVQLAGRFATAGRSTSLWPYRSTTRC